MCNRRLIARSLPRHIHNLHPDVEDYDNICDDNDDYDDDTTASIEPTSSVESNDKGRNISHELTLVVYLS